MTGGYGRAVELSVRRYGIGLLIFAGIIVLAVLMMRSIPGAFLPPEDQGYLLGAVIMPDSASLDRTESVQADVTDYFMKQEGVSSVTVISGFSLLDSQIKNNAGTFFVGLKGFDERYSSANIRTQNARALLVGAYKSFASIQQGIIIPLNPPSIPDLAPQAAPEMWIQSKGDGTIGQLAQVVQDFIAKAKSAPELTGCHFDVQCLVATVARRCGSRQVIDAWRPRRPGLQRDADDVRLALRVSVQSFEPPLASDPSGGTVVSSQAGRTSTRSRARLQRQHGAAQIGRQLPVCNGTGPDYAVQQLPRRQDYRQRRTGLQLGAGHREARGTRPANAGGL